jgi:APA family basic amino acid/polyamine antiporter
MIVIGGIIGSGIFINPYIVAGRLSSSALVLAAWMAGGAIARAGALSYDELGSLFPRVGGQYGVPLFYWFNAKQRPLASPPDSRL